MKTHPLLRCPSVARRWPLLFSLLALTASASAATRFVTTTSDDPANTGSLRYALNSAAAGDTIQINITGTMITGSTVEISKAVTIEGPTKGTFTIQRSGQTQSRFSVLTVTATGNVTLRRLKVTNGDWTEGGGLWRPSGFPLLIEDCQFVANRASSRGGGLFLTGDGTVTMRRCAIQDNTAGSLGGGGIYHGPYGTLDVRQCSFTGNKTTYIGGALREASAGIAKVVHCTFSGNLAEGGSALSIDSNSRLTLLGSTITQNGPYGSAVSNGSSQTLVGSCIISGNNSSDWGGNGGRSLGYNLVGKAVSIFKAVGDKTNVTDPKLQPLGTYGGTLPVHPPRYDSFDVIDRGRNLTAGYPPKETTDQMGNPRSVRVWWQDPVDGVAEDYSDIGAVELQQEQAQPSTGDIVVNTLSDADDGVAGEIHCSLREALRVANARPAGQPVLIRFHPRAFVSGNPQLTIRLFSALPLISRAMTIQGPGAKVLAIQRGEVLEKFNLLTIGEQHTEADISGLTLSGGSSTLGGGLYVASTGALKLSDCHVTGCHATQGGGGLFCKDGTIIIRNCSFWNNKSDTNAAAYLQGIGNATITNSTFQGNTAVNGPGTIVSSGNMTLDSCTIVDNYPSGVGSAAANNSVSARNCIITRNYKDDVDSRVTSLGFNLVHFGTANFRQGVNGDQINVEDPKLGPLRNNGGLTYTMALLPGSRAIDKGKSAGLSTDQRGLKRPYDFPGYSGVPGADSADIGAFELQPAGFDIWRAQNFPEDQLSDSSSSPTGDANHSGVPNSLKYLFGVEAVQPLGTAGLQALPQLVRSTSNGRNYLTLSYRKNTLYDGPQEVVQISADMKSWQPAVIWNSKVFEPQEGSMFRSVFVTVDVTGMPNAWLRVYRAE